MRHRMAFHQCIPLLKAGLLIQHSQCDAIAAQAQPVHQLHQVHRIQPQLQQIVR